MCHPHVAGDEASQPVITEVLMYLDELETMKTRDEEIPTPKFALQRVHDILFVIGVIDNWRHTDYFETYSSRTDQWTKVSSTHLNSYSSLLTTNRAMAQIVSRRPVAAEARVRARVFPCGICGGQSGSGIGFFSEFFSFLLSIYNSTVVLHTHII
jgi:hypothetical protein